MNIFFLNKTASSLLLLTLVFFAPFESALVAQKPNLQDENSGQSQDPTLRNYNPVPSLKVAKTKLTAAKFPVIDVHTHFGFKLRGNKTAIAKYSDVMKRNNIVGSISFDAPLGNEDSHLAFIKPYDSQIAFFAHLDFVQSRKRRSPETFAVNRPGFVRSCVEQLDAAKAKGAVGLKLFKSFGLTLKNREGKLIKIDDAQFDPIWKRCGELGLPVIMHTADPAAFFQPIDANNERWEELSRHPNWSFRGKNFPKRDSLLAARNRIIARHPKTTFIGAHVANNSEDLATVGKWLDTYPNLMVEISSRINELGRQPYTARKFFLRYQDRILFGTDGPWPELRLSFYWRFLETFDEYIPYSEKKPLPQGMWRIYGIGLPDEVLKKIYHQNALRIMPRLKPMVDANQLLDKPH